MKPVSHLVNAREGTLPYCLNYSEILERHSSLIGCHYLVLLCSLLVSMLSIFSDTHHRVIIITASFLPSSKTTKILRSKIYSR